MFDDVGLSLSNIILLINILSVYFYFCSYFGSILTPLTLPLLWCVNYERRRVLNWMRMCSKFTYKFHELWKKSQVPHTISIKIKPSINLFSPWTQQATSYNQQAPLSPFFSFLCVGKTSKTFQLPTPQKLYKIVKL